MPKLVGEGVVRPDRRRHPGGECGTRLRAPLRRDRRRPRISARHRGRPHRRSAAASATYARRIRSVRNAVRVRRCRYPFLCGRARIRRPRQSGPRRGGPAAPGRDSRTTRRSPLAGRWPRLAADRAAGQSSGFAHLGAPCGTPADAPTSVGVRNLARHRGNSATTDRHLGRVRIVGRGQPVGRSVVTVTAARLLQLFSLLQARREWTRPELADRSGITVRTVRRDIERRRCATSCASSCARRGSRVVGMCAPLVPNYLRGHACNALTCNDVVQDR